MKLQNPQLKGGHYAPIHGISPDMIVTPCRSGSGRPSNMCGAHPVRTAAKTS